MLLDQVTELRIIDVLHRGIPNKECVAIYVEESVNIARYGLMLGISTYSILVEDMATPVRDHFFWFGEGVVKQGDWIFVYTGSGTNTTSSIDDGANSQFTLYWGRPATLFYNSNVVPVLFRMDGVQVLKTQKALPQS